MQEWKRRMMLSALPKKGAATPEAISDSKRPMNEAGDILKEDANNDLLLVKTFAETQKTGSNSVMWAAQKTQSTTTSGGHNDIKKAVKFIIDGAMCLGSHRSKVSQDPSTASQIGKFTIKWGSWPREGTELLLRFVWAWTKHGLLLQG